MQPKQSGNTGRTRSVSLAIMAATGIALGAASASAQNGVVWGQINVKDSVTIRAVPGSGMQNRALGGGRFSLHAGAELTGAAAPNPQIQHLPVAGQPVAAAVLPCIIVNPGDAADRQRARYRTLAGAPPATYADMAKDFNIPAMANPHTSTQASRTVTTAAVAPNFPMPFNTVSSSEGKVVFIEDPARTYNVDPAGSFAKIDGSSQRGTGTNRRNGPAGQTSSLVLDPMSFQNMLPGESLLSIFSLDADDFRAQASDPGTAAMMVAEVGTNLPLSGSPQWSTPDGPQSSYAGNSLVFRLDVNVTSSGVNVDFAYDPRFTFFDPADSSETPLSDPAQFVRNQLIGALDPTAQPGDLLTLIDDVDLFGYKATAIGNVSTLQVDYLGGNVVTTPTPGAAGLLGVAGLFVIGRRRR